MNSAEIKPFEDLITLWKQAATEAWTSDRVSATTMLKRSDELRKALNEAKAAGVAAAVNNPQPIPLVTATTDSAVRLTNTAPAVSDAKQRLVDSLQSPTHAPADVPAELLTPGDPGGLPGDAKPDSGGEPGQHKHWWK